MDIRLGFVAMTLRLKDCSPSKTVTLKNLAKIPDYQDQINRLTRLAKENLNNTLRILKANLFDQIMVYRLTSKLIPLCTHPKFREWDYLHDLHREFQAIGEFVRNHGLRVSMHPDHFTLLNSPSDEVLESSLRDLEYHTNVFEAMGLENDAKLVIHVGGKYDNKAEALARFKRQFTKLPEQIRERLIIENDDRCFTASEVLKLCQEIKAPMVLDVHHHQLLNHGEDLASMLPEIFATWTTLPPKVHFSSPKNNQNPRNHGDFIPVDTAMDFIKLARQIGRNFDIMLEAKEKDLALIKLANDLKEHGFQLVGFGKIKL